MLFLTIRLNMGMNITIQYYFRFLGTFRYLKYLQANDYNPVVLCSIRNTAKQTNKKEEQIEEEAEDTQDKEELIEQLQGFLRPW